MLKKIMILLGIFLFLIPVAIAQISEPNNICPDKCENGILFLKGTFDSKARICNYVIRDTCKYGCDNKSSNPFCSEFPNNPPINASEYDQTIWNMVKKIWDSQRLKGSLGMFGTEYVLGQNGTLFLKLLDNNELPINNGFCSMTVYYPNKTIKFMDNSPTTFLGNGLYYKDFFVPTTEGLYIADAICIYDDNVFRYNIPSENCGYDGNIVGGTSPQPLTFSEVDCVPFQTSGSGNYQNWTFNYTSIGLINLSAISQIDVNWVGEVGATANLQLYNFNTLAWNTLGTTIANTGVVITCGNNVYMTRSMTTNITSYVRNDTIKARISVSTAPILTDSIEVVLHNNGSVVASLRGSSEVHVSNFFNQTSNLTVNLNQTQISQILGAIASVNQTLNTTAMNYLIAINGTVFQINQSQYSNYLSMLTAINSVNTTANQTLSFVVALNQSLFNLSNDELSHFNQLLALLNLINSTTNINTQYLVEINDTTHNISANQMSQFITLIQAINSVNFTANTTIENKLDDIFVILKDINFTTNTTLEYKLDLINYTTWQSWVMLQNLTIGNVTVLASVNWTEGVPYIWNASGKSQVDYQLLSMSSEGIQMATETLTCLGNTTLQHILNVTNCVSGTCDTYNRTSTEICAWGCANNQCLPQPQFQYMYAIAFALIVIGLMILVWRGTRKGGL